MRLNDITRTALATLSILLPAATAGAQWLNYPTPGVPRLPDGRPNLSAPAPKTPDGKPDLSGIWSGAGPSYRFNIAQDLETKDIQPWAEALFIKRVRDSRMDSPLSKCLPVSVPYHNFFNLTRIVQTPALTVMLYESANVPPRTIFTDGRELPKDPNPTWFGYSVGRWDGDTLVITTAGFNDQGWLDSSGHPQTESLRLTERLRRRDYGHLDFETTVDDPKVFTKPFTIKRERTLSPDTQLLEDVCENERSRARMSGDTGVRLSPDQVAPLVGVYETAPGREFSVTVTDDLVFVRGLNEPRVPLLVQSETRFMSTTTPIGFEFFKDARGNVTHVLVRGGQAAEEKVRPEAMTIRLALSLALVLAISGAVATQAPPAGLRLIIPGHYVYTFNNNGRLLNSGIVATSDGALVFDALGTEAVARAERQAIADVIKQPVRYLVSSPFHDPFSGGNRAYADVFKIAHENYRAGLIDQMQRGNVPADVQQARLPSATFRDRMSFHLGGKEIQLLHLGPAHTKGDTILFVPQDRIVYMSEVFFNEEFPNMAGGYGVSWITVLDAVRALDADIFIPGHGPVPDDPKQTRAALGRARQILVDARDGVQGEIAKGASEDQTVAAITLPQYDKLYAFGTQREVVLRRIYKELKGTLP